MLLLLSRMTRWILEVYDFIKLLCCVVKKKLVLFLFFSFRVCSIGVHGVYSFVYIAFTCVRSRTLRAKMNDGVLLSLLT